MVKLHQEKVAVIISNSPIRLIVGGSARLVRLDKTHHVAIKGITTCNPRARIIVRL